jgi:hypothetical protein
MLETHASPARAGAANEVAASSAAASTVDR